MISYTPFLNLKNHLNKCCGQKWQSYESAATRTFLPYYLVTTVLLREKCPNTESFLFRNFRHSDSIRRYSSYLSVFSPNVGKYEPEKNPYLDTFHVVTIRLSSSTCFKWTYFQLINNNFKLAQATHQRKKSHLTQVFRK